MVNIFDYIFWRWYCFFCKHKFFKGMEAMDAAGMIFLLFLIPICTLLGRFTYYGWIPRIGDNEYEGRYIMILIFLPFYFIATYRYLFCSKIKNNDYEIFRKKWGNEPLPVRKRRKWLIIVLFIFNCIIIPIAPIVVTILSNRRFIILGHLIQW